jgi:hypothetical protein
MMQEKDPLKKKEIQDQKLMNELIVKYGKDAEKIFLMMKLEDAARQKVNIDNKKEEIQYEMDLLNAASPIEKEKIKDAKLRNELMKQYGEEWEKVYQSMEDLKTARENNYLSQLEKEYELLLKMDEKGIQKNKYIAGKIEQGFSPEGAEEAWEKEKRNKGQEEYNAEVKEINDLIEKRIELMKKLGIEDKVISFSGDNDTAIKEFKEIEDLLNKRYELVNSIRIIEGKDLSDHEKLKIKLEQENDIFEKRFNIIKQINDSLKDGDLSEYFSGLEQLAVVNQDAGLYTTAKAGQAGMNLIQGTDVGNFVEGTMQDGPIFGLINMLVGAVTNALGGIEGISLILSPISGMLKQLSPLLKTILFLSVLFTSGLVQVAEKFMGFLNWITGGLFDDVASEYDRQVEMMTQSTDEREKEAELLKQLNNQYEKLYEAITEQEEYYLRKRRELNADWYAENVTKVNDMILTPHGTFSTSPDDYIIATKNPQSIGGGNTVKINMQIINNANADVTATSGTGPDGIHEILILIDNMVQNNIATGKYNGAFTAMENRNSGRRFSR